MTKNTEEKGNTEETMDVGLYYVRTQSHLSLSSTLEGVLHGLLAGFATLSDAKLNPSREHSLYSILVRMAVGKLHQRDAHVLESHYTKATLL